MRTRRFWKWLGSAAALSGCISVPVKAPELQQVSLGGREVEFRDYRKADVCQAEPQWLVDELRGVNRLLREWTSAAELEDGKLPAPAQRELIDQGREVLPGVVAAYGPTLDRLGQCGWGFEAQLKEAPKEGRELIARVKQQLAELPQRIAAAELAAARAEWRRSNPLKRDKAKETWCPAGAAAAASTDIYFAYQDEQGVTRWLFCNGAEVAQAPEGTASLSKPPPPRPAPRRRKKLPPPPEPKAYLEAAATWPAKEIDRAPTAAN